jgi:predicted RNA-binding protein YlqC (UPF0109 family)
MTDMDQAFVEYVVKALVTNPDAVVVKRSVDDMGVLLELTVDPVDMGKVIGKAGATAKSIRTLLRVLGAKNDARVNLKIVEPEGAEPREPREPREADQEHDAAPEATEEVVAEEEMAPEEAGEDLRAKTAREMADLADLDI